MTKTAADRLFRKTGTTPSDVQVVELHDCFSANELITYEALGLCAPGKAAELIDRGDNTYGGKYVVNPSGGLISKGHPLGATGLAQCAELCWQLRNEAGARQVPGAKLALQHNLGLGGAVVVALYRLGFPEYRSRQIGVGRVAAGFSLSDFAIAPYLRLLEQAMAEENSLLEKHKGIYGFKVKKPNGEEGYWVINVKLNKGSIEINSKRKSRLAG
jgi:sterol carrier protein 2